jgi:hypothetical protein
MSGLIGQSDLTASTTLSKNMAAGFRPPIVHVMGLRARPSGECGGDGSWATLRYGSPTVCFVTFRFSGGVVAYANMFQLLRAGKNRPAGRAGAPGPQVWPHFGPTGFVRAPVGSGQRIKSVPTCAFVEFPLIRLWPDLWLHLH